MNGEYCPYIENAPRTEEEIFIHKRILSSGAFLRTGGMGTILGLDAAAAIQMMQASGLYDDVMLDLIDAASSGILQAKNTE